MFCGKINWKLTASEQTLIFFAVQKEQNHVVVVAGAKLLGFLDSHPAANGCTSHLSHDSGSLSIKKK